MFTSPKPVVFMVCGHSIHKKCYDQHMMVSYKCPICSKSLANMETQFRNLDLAILSQPMPEEYNGTMAIISCNDCSGRSMVPYHYLGTKCNTCRSYNTRQLSLLGNNSQELQAALNEQNAIVANGQPAVPVVATRSREESTVGRRRHSSQGVEIQRRASDVIAGSYPPLNMRFGPGMEPIDSEDEESNDGIFGYWSRSRGSNEEEEYVSDDDSSDDNEDDDDDEEENGIVLIGHR